MTEPQVTIIVPNYRTPKLTKLCLRLLRKHTDPTQAKVLVVDNYSGDASTEYLRQLSWIELLERDTSQDQTPAASHANALDDALAQVTTPYVLSIHTDTIVKDPQWLAFLLKHIEHDPNIAGVGSWKLEHKSWWRRGLKKIEYAIQRLYYRFTKKTNALEGLGDNYYYLRSHCALYRTAYLKQYGLRFNAGEETAGKVLHKTLADQGHEMIFLPSETLSRYVDHLNHATMVLNPELGARTKTIKKGLKRIKKALKALNAEDILANVSLDQ